MSGPTRVLLAGLACGVTAWNVGTLGPVLNGPVYEEFPIVAWHGRGYAAAMDQDGDDHSWRAYEMVRALYPGWTLIGADRAILFSAMYEMAYSGPIATRIRTFDPTIDATEAERLRAVASMQARVGRVGPLVIVVPPPESVDHRAVMLRAPDGVHILTPMAMAPKRFADLGE